MNLTNTSTIRQLMRKHNVEFSKALGQNFLINPTVCPRMVTESGIGPTTGVLEIGPGMGVLTRELAEVAKKVVAVELDQRLQPILAETVGEFDNTMVIYGDVLKLDLHELIAAHFSGMEVVVCANLPYYITSPIIMKLLEENLPIKSITAMVQKEAGERICAQIPSRKAGAITIGAAFYARSKVLFTVSPGSFLPPPKVESCVIKLEIRDSKENAFVNKKAFDRVVRSMFSQRRKTILNSLSAGLATPKDVLQPELEALGISHTLRPEQLSLEQFYSLASLCTIED